MEAEVDVMWIGGDRAKGTSLAHGELKDDHLRITE
jgi:hypothetical protein